MERANPNLPHWWPLHAPLKFPLKRPIERQVCFPPAQTVTIAPENSFTSSRASKALREKQLPSCCSKHLLRKKKMNRAMTAEQNADFCLSLKTQVEDPRSKTGIFILHLGTIKLLLNQMYYSRKGAKIGS